MSMITAPLIIRLLAPFKASVLILSLNHSAEYRGQWG